jgi:predicted PolB exonuclease-like 3'-5' exonuclease
MEHLRQILFIDIETVSGVPDFNLLSEGMKEQWTRKAKFLKPVSEDTDPAMLFTDRAGIFSEFAKVVCIGIGCLVERDGEWKILLKSLEDDDEKVLLNKFCEAIGRFTKSMSDLRFCGHNIKEFDIPFLCRRMVIHGMKLPECMQLNGKKPWEIPHIDTLDLWRFGDHKNFTSLALLAEVLGIPSPKDDIDGSMVGEVYWTERNLPRIGRYCLQDVYTTARVFLRLKGITGIIPEAQYVTD